MSMSTHSSTKLRIIQHNCARSTNIMHSCLSAAATTADIIFIQEPWISKEGGTIMHPSFQSIIPPTQGTQRPRTLTFVTTTNPHVKVTPKLDILSDPDCQVLDISTTQIPTITFFNVYNERNRGNNGRREFMIDRLFPTLTFPNRTIITGNMNAHHE